MSTDHLREITELAGLCIDDAIQLLPDYDESRTEAETTKLALDLLIRLRAIRQEADLLRKGEP